MTPFHVEIKDMSGQQVLTMKRETSFFGFAPILIMEEKGMPIGQLVRKFRLGGAKIDINDMINEIETYKNNNQLVEPKIIILCQNSQN